MAVATSSGDALCYHRLQGLQLRPKLTPQINVSVNQCEIRTDGEAQAPPDPTPGSLFVDTATDRRAPEQSCIREAASQGGSGGGGSPPLVPSVSDQPCP